MHPRQRTLFDEDYQFRAQYSNALQRLDCQAALDLLSGLRPTLGRVQNAPAKAQAVEKLSIALRLLAPDDAPSLAELMFDLPIRLDLAALSEDISDLRKGFIQSISAVCERKGIFGYITPRLHPAEAHIEMGKFDEAIEAIRQFVALNGEDSLLRQMQSYAFFKTGKDADGYRCLVYALFNNPLRCDERFLFASEVSDVFDRLKAESEEVRLAWARLPFHLWECGTIAVGADSMEFENYLKNVTDRKPIPESGPAERGVQFARLLFLAEALWRNNAGADEIAAIRQKMREVDAEMFERYMGAIRLRRKESPTR